MNTNGTGSRDTWGQEHRGWAPLAEQWGDKEREVAKMPQRGVLGHQDPQSNTHGMPRPRGQGMKADLHKQLGGHQDALGVLDQATVGAEQRVQKAYALPNTIFGLDPFYPPKPLRYPLC